VPLVDNWPYEDEPQVNLQVSSTSTASLTAATCANIRCIEGKGRPAGATGRNRQVNGAFHQAIRYATTLGPIG